MLSYYDAALKRFNTSRASIFRQESNTHKYVKTAAEKMINMRKEFGVLKDVQSVMESITDPQDKKEFAKRWLKTAKDLHYEARNYVHVKNPKTFAGADRYGGARDLRQVAKREVGFAENAIRRLGGNDFTLDSLYKDIANDKLKDAYQDIKNLDFKDPTEKLNGRSISDQKNDKIKFVIKKLSDALAANASFKKLTEQPQSAAINNFYSLRTSLDRDAVFTNALKNYLSRNWNKDTILKDLENGCKGLGDKLASRNLYVDRVIKPDAKAVKKAGPGL